MHSIVPRNCFWEIGGEFGDLGGTAFPRAPGYLWVPTRIKTEKMKKKKQKKKPRTLRNPIKKIKSLPFKTGPKQLMAKLLNEELIFFYQAISEQKSKLFLKYRGLLAYPQLMIPHPLHLHQWEMSGIPWGPQRGWRRLWCCSPGHTSQ